MFWCFVIDNRFQSLSFYFICAINEKTHSVTKCWKFHIFFRDFQNILFIKVNAVECSHPNCINRSSAVDGTCNDCKNDHFGWMCQRIWNQVCLDDTCDKNEGMCSNRKSPHSHMNKCVNFKCVYYVYTNVYAIYTCVKCQRNE